MTQEDIHSSETTLRNLLLLIGVAIAVVWIVGYNAAPCITRCVSSGKPFWYCVARCAAEGD